MVFLAMLLLQGATLAPTAATIDDAGLITVTASRIGDLEAAAARCQRHGCPAREDIAVSVAYASALFDAGDYLKAKRLLAGTVGRTGAAAKAEPLAVSTLYQAQATLAAHEGDQEIMRTASWASAVVLRDALPEGSLPLLTAELRLADWQMRVAHIRDAEARYADIAARAGAAGQQAIADVAALRRALALHAMGRRAEARAGLEALAARPDPGGQDGSGQGELRRAALATSARLAAFANNQRGVDGYAERLAAEAPGAEPLLLSSAPMPRPGQHDAGGLGVVGLDLVGMDRGARSADLNGLRWVDIGFRIGPDGRVDDVRILRGSTTQDWAGPLLGYVGSRRYSASPGAGYQRVERYTLTADYSTPVGSLIRRRVRNPRFEMMPVTVPEPVASAD